MHLILQLLPVLQKTAKEHQDARIVVQASSMHNLAPSAVKFENLAEINTDIGPSYLYHRSKLAQILFIRGLVQRLNDGRLGPGDSTNIFVNATHPGAVNTTQPEQAEEAYGLLGKIVAAGIRPFMKDPITEGCLPALFAATSPDVKTQGTTGQYVSALPCTTVQSVPWTEIHRLHLRQLYRSRQSRHIVRSWLTTCGPSARSFCRINWCEMSAGIVYMSVE
jgi:WW domain-containing oxidoreductase